MRKGEYAGFKHFLLFPNMFWKMFENIVGNTENTGYQYFLLFMPLVSVCLSFCLSLQFWTKKLNISLLLLNLFSCKAHIWYEGTSHRYTSAGTKVKVLCEGGGQISRSHFSRNGCLKGISVPWTHLVPQCFQKSSFSGLLKVGFFVKSHSVAGTSFA